MLFNNLISTDRCRPSGQSDTRAEVFGGWNRLCFWRHSAAGLEPQLLFRPRRYRLARRGLERAGLPAHYPRCSGIGLYRRSGPSVPAAGSRWRWWGTGIVRERTDLVQQKSGRALCHCFAGRFDSAAFCAFGGRRRRFGRRQYPLPTGGGGRRQRQPSAFRLSRWPVCRNTSSTATVGCSRWTSAMWRTSNIITTTTNELTKRVFADDNTNLMERDGLGRLLSHTDALGQHTDTTTRPNRVKVYDAGKIIGASDGVDTPYIRAECSQGGG